VRALGGLPLLEPEALFRGDRAVAGACATLRAEASTGRSFVIARCCQACRPVSIVPRAGTQTGEVETQVA